MSNLVPTAELVPARTEELVLDSVLAPGQLWVKPEEGIIVRGKLLERKTVVVGRPLARPDTVAGYFQVQLTAPCRVSFLKDAEHGLWQESEAMPGDIVNVLEYQKLRVITDAIIPQMDLGLSFEVNIAFQRRLMIRRFRAVWDIDVMVKELP
jgi:hypothetical protein